MWLQGYWNIFFTSLYQSQVYINLTCSFLKKISSSKYADSTEGFNKISFFVELFSFTLPKKERDVRNRFPRSSFQPFANKGDIYTQIRILVEVHLPKTFWASDFTCSFTWVWWTLLYTVKNRTSVLSHILFFYLRTAKRHFITQENNLM